MICEFFVPGKPVPKARARVVRRGNGVGSYTPEATVNYESMVKVLAMNAMGGRPPVLEPIALHLSINVAPLASWSYKRRESALWGEFMPTKKPDMSNILKSIEDGMNRVVYHDDSQICTVAVFKRYADREGVGVTVRALDAKPAP